MNDIYLVSNKFSCILYADDTTLNSPLCSFDMLTDRLSFDRDELSKNINIEIKLITDWLALNKLSLNAKKTKFMIFHYHQRKISSFIPELKIHDLHIERVSKFNFLGLMLDENMTWKEHTHKIANKISRSLGIMNKLKRVLPQSILKLLYNSLILPHLQYSILCWGANPGKTVKLQKRAIRILAGIKYNAHTELWFRKFELLKVTDIFKVSMLRFNYKLQNETSPAYFKNILSEPYIVLHDHDTRIKRSISIRFISNKNCLKVHSLPIA